MALTTEEMTSSTEALTIKLNEILSDTDNDVGQFCFKEETIEQFMQELYKEIIASPPKPLSPPPTPSSNGSLVVQLDPQDVSMEFNVGEETKDDEDDEWLARVLSWGQAQPHAQVMDTSDWF